MYDFSFEFPSVFIFLALFVLSHLFLRVKEQFYFLPNLHSSLPPQTKKKKDYARFFHFLSIVFVFISLANPLYVVQKIDKNKHALDIVLSIDTSGSMSLQGLDEKEYSKSRLDVVKDVLKEFVDKRAQDNIGVVLFGDRSGVASALSQDKDALLLRIEGAKVGVFGKSTALIESIVQSSLLLKQGKSSTKIIILLSDGEDTASKVPLSIALKIAKKSHIKIYTISMGESNNNLLELIAKESGAQNFVVKSKKDLQAVYATISHLEEQTQNTNITEVVHEKYRYFLFLALVSLALFARFSQKTSPNQLKKLLSGDIFSKILLYPELEKKRGYQLLYGLVVLLLVVAFFTTKTEEKKFPLETYVLALNTATSMNRTDIYPSRFAAAKKKVVAFLQMHPQSQVALVLFNTQAYLAYPMSQDKKTLAMLVQRLKPTKIEEDSLFTMLQGAAYLLANFKEKNIVLFSDNSGITNMQKELHYLQKKSLHLHTFLIQSKSEEAESLEKISLQSGGRFVPYSYASQDVTHLHQKREILPSLELVEHLSFYLILMALLLLLFTYLVQYDLKRDFFGLFLLFVFVSLSPQAKADLLDFKKLSDAKKCYQEGEYASASKLYAKLASSKRVEYNLANALYKAREYKEAITHYKHALGETRNMNARIYYNIGNAYYFLHKLHAAKKYYILSLKDKLDTEAQENLKIVLYLLKHHSKSTNKKYSLPKNKRSYKQEEQAISSSYTLRLQKIIASEEERWMQVIEKNRPLLFLQKLPSDKEGKND